MADTTSELLAIEAFIKSVVPGVRVEKQTAPLSPSSGLFVVRYLNGTPTNETGYHYRIEREYQLIYYSARPQDSFAVMDALSTAFYTEQRLASVGSRVDSFIYGQPAKTSTDRAAVTNAEYSTLGILRLTSRQSRPQQTYPLIQNVNSRFN